MVAISGYNSSLYEMHLGSWRKKSWQVRTHRRTVQETLWMNYERPEKLYTYDYLGRDRTERQRIRRKIMRWKSKLATLDPQERNAILNELQ